jgi:flagellin
MPGINTSMGTSASMKSLLKTEREMLSAMERISSGKRINNAGDDAAGAAISDRMSATIRALDMSIRNAADVLSMAQVAEGALDEHSAALQRIRELSIQAATDILNAEQRVYLQTEVNQLLSEMDRVSRDTTFNEIAVLDGTFADRRFQIGSHEREKAVISIANMRNDMLGAYQASTQHTAGETNLAANVTVGDTAPASKVANADDFNITGLLGTATIDVTAGNTAKDIVELVNDKFDNTGVSATATTTVKLQVNSTAGAMQGTGKVVSMNITGKNSTAQSITAQIGIGATTATSDLTDLRDQFNAYSATTGISATLSADKSSIMLVQDEGLDIVIDTLDFAGVTTDVKTTILTATSFDQAQATPGSAIEMYDESYNTATSDSMRVSGIVTFHSSQSFSIVPANANGGIFESTAIASTLNKISTINVTTMAGAVDALKVVDRALDRVHMERAKFGALMSRMNVVIDNLTTISQSQRASKSRILDADFAKESARLAKSQILQQSAMNMIAQASRTMQNVLVLFQG